MLYHRNFLYTFDQKTAQDKKYERKRQPSEEAFGRKAAYFVQDRHELNVDEINAEGLSAEKGERLYKTWGQFVERKHFEKQKDGGRI